jgi:hypothetical protein
VDRNPLNESIQYALWISAAKPDEVSGSSATGASSVLSELIGKYQALVADQGLHYVEISEMMDSAWRRKFGSAAKISKNHCPIERGRVAGWDILH